MEAITGFRHLFSPVGLITFPFEGYVLGTAPTARVVGSAYIPSTEEEVMTIPLPISNQTVSPWSHPLDYLL